MITSDYGGIGSMQYNATRRRWTATQPISDETLRNRHGTETRFFAFNSTSHDSLLQLFESLSHFHCPLRKEV